MNELGSLRWRVTFWLRRCCLEPQRPLLPPPPVPPFQVTTRAGGGLLIGLDLDVINRHDYKHRCLLQIRWRDRLVHLRVQSGARYGGIDPVAALWPVRRRPVGQSDSWLADEQVQRLWLCHDDQLRRGPRRHSVAQRLHSWQPRPSGSSFVRSRSFQSSHYLMGIVWVCCV